MPLARWLCVAIGVLCIFVPWATVPPLSFAISLVLTALTGLLIWSLGRAHGPTVDTKLLVGLMALGSGFGVLATCTLLIAQDANVVVAAVFTAGLAVLGLRSILAPTPPATLSIALLVSAYILMMVVAVSVWGVHIDVESFVRGALDALGAGRSPYNITIENLYTPEQTPLYYGPDVVAEGRVVYGFPYLPAVLLLDLPAHLLADAVWMHLALLLVALGLAWRLTTDQLGRAAVVTLALSPTMPVLIVNYWIEPVLIGLVALTVWGLARGRSWAIVVGLGLLFSSKQYALFFLPAVWPVLRRAGFRCVLVAGVVAAVILAAFVVLDPGAFYRSAVELQFKQPFRDDAVSFLPALRAAVGDFPSWMLAVLPFGGFVVSGIVALRTSPGPTAFALCVGLGLLASVVLSKVGFVNYFMLIGAALLLAGITWPIDDPIQTREPLSQGSRGSRGMSKTR